MRILAGIFVFLFAINLSAQPCLNFSTFFGQLQHDEIRGVCSDPSKNMYVIGNTYNTNLPVTSGAFQSNLKGGYEAFLAKFDSCGSLIWCTYLGTSGFDSGEKITYSRDNAIVICGYTDGLDLDTTTNCFQAYNRGSYDCFVGKFTTSGMPQWLTYFGAGGGDFSYDVKTDSLNNVIIGGTSISNALYTTPNSFQQFQAGATDAFIARFNSKGNLKFSTFFGGSNSEDIHALAIDKHCNIIGVGGSFSFNLNTSAGCYQASSNGGMEVYVLKLDSTGQRIFSTYIGSTGTDDAYGVCTDNSDFIYISGHTNGGTFYTSPGAYQPIKSGMNDCYCLSLSPTGTMLWSTFIGGSSNDFLARMHLNSNKELVLLSSSQSSDFPMLGINNTTVNTGGSDVVITKMLTNGTPFWASYLGGSSSETPYETISISKSKIVVVGSTTSADFPISTLPYQSTFNGTEDGFITCRNVGFSLVSGISNANETVCDLTTNSLVIVEDLICNYNCFPDEMNYIIKDITGKIIENGKMQRTKRINVSGWSVGVYYIQLTSHNGYQTKAVKFIKQ